MNQRPLETIADRARRVGVTVVGPAAPASDPAGEAMGRWAAGLEAPARPGFEILESTPGWCAGRASDAEGGWVVLGVPPGPGVSADRVRSMLEVLGESFEDLLAQADHDGDVTIFTHQLDQTYETVTLLYRLGRSLSAFREPTPIVERTVDELRSLFGFAWGGAVFFEHEASLGELSGTRLVRCDDADRAEEIGRRISALLGCGAGNLATTAVNGIAVLPDPEDVKLLGREVVLRELYVGGEPVGWVVLGDKHEWEYPTDEGASSAEVQAAEAATSLLGATLETRRLYIEQERMFLGMLEALSNSLDAKDPYTRGHSERVALLAQMLAEQIGMSEAEVEEIHLAGSLHDIGKIGVPDRVLCKPGRLTDEEFDEIKRHPRLGHDILAGIPSLSGILPGVLHHHEKWNGRGYPEGIAGDDIPVQARILALADTFDAMSSNRAYRACMPREKVLEEIRRVSGEQFDPELTGPFVAMDFSAFDAMKARHEETDAGQQRVERDAA